MKFLRFGHAAKAEAASATTPSTRRGIVLIDDIDLTRYLNNYQLYDTGPRSGRLAMDFLVASARTRPPLEKTKALGHDVVMMLDDSVFDTPVISEDGSALAASGVHERPRKHSMSAVDILPIPHNAIRTGGPVKLFGTQYGGLVVNWFLLGFFQGATQTLVELFFAHYLHIQRDQRHAMATLLQSAWLWKIVAAFLTDACPFHGERRKPYVYLGWALVGLCMLVLVCIPTVEPYFSAQGDVVNRDATTQGVRYVPWLGLAYLGHLLVTVACEGMVVELAQREAEFVRGRVQCTVIAIELVGQFLGTIVVAFGLNSVSFGGTFPSALPLQVIFGFLGFLAMVGMFLTWFVILDEVKVPAQSRVSQLRHLGHIAQRRPICKLIVFGFLCYGALACDVAARYDVYSEWLHARPLAHNLSLAASLVAAAMATFLVSRVWINTNWRALVLGCLALGIAIGLPIDLITYSAVWRNVVFFAVKDVVVRAFGSVIQLVPLLLVVEVAEPGFEASTYALVAMACKLAGAFVPIVTNILVSVANVEKQDPLVDSSSVRRHLVIEQVVFTTVRILLLLAAVPFVPRQKRHAKELNARGTYGGLLAYGVHGAFFIVYGGVVASTILSLSASTACLVLAGGGGCD